MKKDEIFPPKTIELKIVESLLDHNSELVFFFPEEREFTYPVNREFGSVTILPDTSGKKTIYVSLGDRKKKRAEIFRKAAASFSRWGATQSGLEIGLDLDQTDLDKSIEYKKAVLEGLCLGGYEPSRHKTKDKKKNQVMMVCIKKTESIVLSAAIEHSEIVGEAVDLARDWIQEPANFINPEILEERARTLSEMLGLSFKTIRYDDLVKMGAGGITAVGRGSQAKPRMIVLEYKGCGSERPIVLVGKAITFDTGGYSLKGVEYIQGMKYDKAGGIAVLAVLMAAARLKLKVNLVGIVPAAENMISGDAYRPDDILTLLSGQTVEIVSTDAEGRLILSDALSYAQQEYKPQAIIDIATLTGGVKIALGKERAGLLCNSDKLADIIYMAGEETGEKVWKLPLDDEYFDLLKSDDADMKNSGPREAQTIVGAMFLKQAIADDLPWAHIDIAATGSSEAKTPWASKGANGFGVRLILETVIKLFS